MINVTCKKCKTCYRVPEQLQDFKCGCFDPFPNFLDPGLLPCNCVEMLGDIICLSSCQQRQELQRREELWRLRKQERDLFKIKEKV